MDTIEDRVEHTVTALDDIYASAFGGKKRGRFRIRRAELRTLAGLKRLAPGFLRRLAQACYEAGYALIDRDDDFVLIDHDLFDNYRKVPKATAAAYEFEEEGGDDDQDDTEEAEDDDADGGDGGDDSGYSDDDIAQLAKMLRECAAKRKTTRYTPVAQPFGLDMSNPEHRNTFAGMLAQVSIAEHEAGRGMLSSVVIREDLNKPGNGYFELAEELGLFDPASDDKDDFWIKELNKVYAANRPARTKSARRADA